MIKIRFPEVRGVPDPQPEAGRNEKVRVGRPSAGEPLAARAREIMIALTGAQKSLQMTSLESGRLDNGVLVVREAGIASDSIEKLQSNHEEGQENLAARASELREEAVKTLGEISLQVAEEVRKVVGSFSEIDAFMPKAGDSEIAHRAVEAVLGAFESADTKDTFDMSIAALKLDAPGLGRRDEADLMQRISNVTSSNTIRQYFRLKEVLDSSITPV